MGRKKQDIKYAKPRRVRPGNNIAYCRQQLDDLKADMAGIVAELERELLEMASRRQAAISAAHRRMEELERRWDRLANYVARLAKEQA